jgi:tyrosine-protein phosphatase SIW14
MEQITPPINYSQLCPGIHRSGYPTKRNFSFLATLKLKSIVFLCPEAYAEANARFCEEQGILFFTVRMEGNKEPFIDIPADAMHRALSIVCDVRNHPLLIHCNKGKHRTGAVCGCVRQVQGWSLTSTFDEYLRFAGDKARFVDQQYMELYEPRIFHIGPASLDAIAPWVVRRDAVRIITPADPEAALVSQPGPLTGDDDGKEKKEKKDKKDKKDKKEKEKDAADDDDGGG